VVPIEFKFISIIVIIINIVIIGWDVGWVSRDNSAGSEAATTSTQSRDTANVGGTEQPVQHGAAVVGQGRDNTGAALVHV
jgi:hypothetical protein